MDWGDAGSLAAVVVAVVALLFARQSVRAAKRSAKAAEGSEEVARVAEHYAQRPRFTISVADPVDGASYVTVRMLDGPTQISVDAGYQGTAYLPGEPGGPLASQPLGSGWSTVAYLVRGEAIGFALDLPSDVEELTIEVEMECEDAADESRRWHHREVVEWPAGS